jgi:DNA mismatch repair protein MutS2
VGLAELVDRAAPGQLLLVDEIASGTDPAQGAALGQAVLEWLADRGPRVVATTHFASLKGLAATDERFAVAAVEVLGGRPTYRVLPGVAGESHALSVAARVGLPGAVLDRALALLGSQQAELGRLLRELDEERGRAAEATAAAERDRAEAARAAAAVAEREEVLRTRIRDLEERGAAAFLERLRSAEVAIGRVVADLQRAPSHERARAARAAVGALGSLADLTNDHPSPEPPRLSPGDRVKHVRLGGPGEVVSADGDTVEVRIGSLVMRVPPDELRLVRRSGKSR